VDGSEPVVAQLHSPSLEGRTFPLTLRLVATIGDSITGFQFLYNPFRDKSKQSKQTFSPVVRRVLSNRDTILVLFHLVLSCDSA
jgi:hypothetical protein